MAPFDRDLWQDEQDLIGEAMALMDDGALTMIRGWEFSDTEPAPGAGGAQGEP
jgi:hypothetical protein